MVLIILISKKSVESAGKTLPRQLCDDSCVILLSLAPNDLRQTVHIKESLLLCRS